VVATGGLLLAPQPLSRTGAPAAWAGPPAPRWSLLGGNFAAYDNNYKNEVGYNADGRLELFAMDQTPGLNQLYHQWELPGGGWSGWQWLGAHIATFTLANEADGRLEVFAITDDATLRTISQVTRNGGWGVWSAALATNLSPTPITVGRDPSGGLHIFTGQGTHAGTVVQLDEAGPNGTWGPPQTVGSFSAVTKLVTAYNADGRPEVFAVAGDGQVYHRWQWGNGTWSYWAGLGGATRAGNRELAVTNEADGSLDVFALWDDGSLRAYVQGGPNGGWSAGWRTIAAPGSIFPGNTGLAALSVGRNLDGRLELYVTGATQFGVSPVWLNWAQRLVQPAPGADFAGGWIIMSPISDTGVGPGPSGFTGLYPAHDAAGRLVVFTATIFGTNTNTHQLELWYARQSTPGNWS
jgi:hypothetical protein